MIYVASPYSDPDPSVEEERYNLVCEWLSAASIQHGAWFYSPIAHWHPIAVKHGLPTDAAHWRTVNFEAILKADHLFVLTLPGWEKSVGVKEEMRFAAENGIPFQLVDVRWLR